jgi:glycine cleavage system H protein
MDYPKNYFFTREHEWVDLNNNNNDTAFIGLTEFAIKELGNVKKIEIPSLNKSLLKDQVFGRVHGERFLTKLIMPFDAKVIDINSEYCNNVKVLNEDYCHSHWLIKVKLLQPKDSIQLLTLDEYKSYKINHLLHMIQYLVPIDSSKHN